MRFFATAVDPYLATAKQAIDMAFGHAPEPVQQEIVEALAMLAGIDGDDAGLAIGGRIGGRSARFHGKCTIDG